MACTTRWLILVQNNRFFRIHLASSIPPHVMLASLSSVLFVKQNRDFICLKYMIIIYSFMQIVIDDGEISLCTKYGPMCHVDNKNVITALNKYHSEYDAEIHSCGYFFVNNIGNLLSEQAVREIIDKYYHIADISNILLLICSNILLPYLI